MNKMLLVNVLALSIFSSYGAANEALKKNTVKARYASEEEVITKPRTYFWYYNSRKSEMVPLDNDKVREFPNLGDHVYKVVMPKNWREIFSADQVKQMEELGDRLGQMDDLLVIAGMKKSASRADIYFLNNKRMPEKIDPKHTGIAATVESYPILSDGSLRLQMQYGPYQFITERAASIIREGCISSCHGRRQLARKIVAAILKDWQNDLSRVELGAFIFFNQDDIKNYQKSINTFYEEHPDFQKEVEAQLPDVSGLCKDQFYVELACPAERTICTDLHVESEVQK